MTMDSTTAPYDGSLLALGQLIDRPRENVQDAVRLRCRTSYLGDGHALCRVLGRYNMFVSTSDVGFATHVMMDGAWEMWLTEYMVRTVQPGWTVFDVGANFGYYSLLMSDLVQHTGRCIAFEPNPAVARSTRRNLAINGFESRSEVREIALSRDDGTATFYLPNNEPKNARIVAGIDQQAVDGRWGEYIDVTMRALDREYSGRIDFLKIDVEGAEGAVIEGMWNIIQAHHPRMIVEYNIGRMTDPRPPLQILLDAYGSLRSLETDGSLREVTIERILSERVGTDWLIEVG